MVTTTRKQPDKENKIAIALKAPHKQPKNEKNKDHRAVAMVTTPHGQPEIKKKKRGPDLLAPFECATLPRMSNPKTQKTKLKPFEKTLQRHRAIVMVAAPSGQPKTEKLSKTKRK